VAVLSSTSSSELAGENTSGVGGRWVVREIPDRPWWIIGAVAAAVVAVAVAGWEVHVRHLGYGPTLDDTPNLWAQVRARAVGVRSDQVVFVGASRTLFDMDLTVFQQETGGPLPIQLATVGSNPLIILEDLAGDPSYAGTTIVGIVPALIAAAAGPPVSSPTKFVAHYHTWSVANRMELPLSLWLDERFAFINQDDLTLTQLIDNKLELPLRPKVYAPRLPGYEYTLDRNRQARMIESVARVTKEQERIQQIWLPLFKGPPKPAVFTDEQWGRMMSDGWETNLARLKQAASNITARGGKVIFSRLPSTGGVRELEERGGPRAAIWDRILRETGAPGIYFEDYPELAGFTCPEWSHLSAQDATEYTRRFARILKAKGLL
jgi:hypothetical protein